MKFENFSAIGIDGSAAFACPTCNQVVVKRSSADVLEHFWAKHSMLPIHISDAQVIFACAALADRINGAKA